MVEIKQILVPLALFLFITIVALIALSLIFRYLNRRLALETVKQVMQNGGAVDSVLIKAIVKEDKESNADLRKGAILIASAIATVILGFVFNNMGYQDILSVLVGMAAFPGLIGATYIGLHFSSQNSR